MQLLVYAYAEARLSVSVCGVRATAEVKMLVEKVSHLLELLHTAQTQCLGLDLMDNWRMGNHWGVPSLVLAPDSDHVFWPWIPVHTQVDPARFFGFLFRRIRLGPK